MRSGKLAHVVTLQRSTEIVDEYGTPASTWTDQATLRAEVVERSTEEFIRTQGATDEEVVIFRTRFLDGVTTADRVRFDGQDFNIKEVVPIGRRKGLELRAVRST